MTRLTIGLRLASLPVHDRFTKDTIGRHSSFDDSLRPLPMEPNRSGAPMSDDRLLVYEKPTCTTCRTLVSLLQSRGIDFDRIDYFVDPLDAPTLRSLLKKADLRPRDLLRRRDPAYVELGLDDVAIGDDALIDALVAHPGLLQRPIVVRGDRAVLGRPIERVEKLLR